jgi:hypothetical protein
MARSAPQSRWRSPSLRSGWPTGDCDGDGDEDVFAVHHGTANLSVFVNQQVQGNPGVFAAASGSPFNVDRRAGFVLAADDQGNEIDLDRDGVLDLVIAGRRAVTTLRGDGACGFSVLQSDAFANKPIGVGYAAAAVPASLPGGSATTNGTSGLAADQCSDSPSPARGRNGPAWAAQPARDGRPLPWPPSRRRVGSRPSRALRRHRPAARR